MNTKTATINLPLTSIKPLYRNDEERTLVAELNIDALKSVNELEDLDEIISQARLDYALGDYKSFDHVEDLIADLRS